MTALFIPRQVSSSVAKLPDQPEVVTTAAEAIRVMGTVQGVGFRPTVYRLATALKLRGEVLNDGEGVLIRVVGPQTQINQLVARLLRESPPLAKINCLQRHPLAPETVTNLDFSIATSVQTQARTDIAPDAATCPQCRADLADPRSRYFRYPFTNCTHCGPRLSIIRDLPYDRSATSMAWFALCPSCHGEYHEVTNRRFHAQPIACPVCGPKVWLERADGKPAGAPVSPDRDEVDTVCTLLQQGQIVAIKGLGGVHLACDATSEAAVSRLRQLKGRYHKPLAVMVRDLAAISAYGWLNDQERTLLSSPAAPIVVLNCKSENRNPDPAAARPLAPSLTAGLATLGVMLPYTPLHHLILQRVDRPLVMTSGNRSGQPQCITNEAVREQLGAIAQYFLLHNRDILNRVDDSVVRVNPGDGQIQMIRRARGYAPAPIALPQGFEVVPAVLAMGSELKSTFCLLRSGQAIMSQHLGDLEQGATYQTYQQTLDLYLKLFDFSPELIAVDRHPDYLATKLGKDLAQAQSLQAIPVQHHHAHIAAGMVDHGLPLTTPPVLGIALDGLGYGDDQTLWGGEVLLADYRHCRRLAHLKPVAMLGGSQAIRQPWRSTYAHLVAAWGGWNEVYSRHGNLPLVQFLAQQPRQILDQMLAQGLNAPLASSTGRLFDAVAAALNICRQQVSYEGQAAIELEALIQPDHLQLAEASAYRFGLGKAAEPDGENVPLILDPGPMWWGLLADMQRGTAVPLMAARFHLGLGNAIATLALGLVQRHGLTTVVLSGGSCQNQILTTQIIQGLASPDLRVLTHRQVPANDGGLSLGQAVVAAARQIDQRPSEPRPPG